MDISGIANIADIADVAGIGTDIVDIATDIADVVNIADIVDRMLRTLRWKQIDAYKVSRGCPVTHFHFLTVFSKSYNKYCNLLGIINAGSIFNNFILLNILNSLYILTTSYFLFFCCF